MKSFQMSCGPSRLRFASAWRAVAPRAEAAGPLDAAGLKACTTTMLYQFARI